MSGPVRPEVRLGVLGPLEVTVEGRAVALGGVKQRAVLALLVLSANRVVSVDRLIDQVWGDEPPARAMSSLQAYISRLRRLLQPADAQRHRSDIVLTRAPGYLLRVPPESIDAVCFERQVAEAARMLGSGDAVAALATFDQALASWRGTPYADLEFEQFTQPEVARLHELRLSAIEGRLEALLQAGHAGVAVGDAEALVREHPLREGSWAALMTALHRAGRTGDALRAYQRARQTLADELGVEPGGELQSLEAWMLHQAPSGPSPRRLPAIDPAVPAASASAPAPADGTGVGLIGREDQIEAVDQALRRAVAGRGGALLIHGEPGIGKTGLARHAAAGAERLGAVVGWGGGVEGDVTTAYWPWTHALRQVLEPLAERDVPVVVRQALRDVTHVDPALAQWADGPIELPVVVDPAVMRARLQRAVLDTVLGLASWRPVTLVLEDLHWVDPASLQVVAALAGEVTASPVLLVLTYRDEEVDRALAATVAALHRLPGSVDVPLGGLDGEAVHRFVEETVGHEVSASVAASIARRTGGNPLFVGELTRLLRSERALDPTATDDIEIPAGVREVIQRRLERLPPQTVTVLTLAATIGRQFPLDLLARVAQLGDDDVLDGIEAAVATGLAVESSDASGRFGFTHDLIREALQASIGLTRRTRLHARVAEALLEAPTSDDPGRPFELSHHLVQAMPVIPAVVVLPHLVAAADVAAERFAYEQAEEELRRALRVLDQLPAGERGAHEVGIRARLGRVLTITRGHASPEEREQATLAARLIDRSGPTDDRRLALWGAALSAVMAADFATPRTIGHDLLAEGEALDDRAARFMGHAMLGGCSWQTADLVGAEHHLDRAIELIDSGSVDVARIHDRTHGVWSLGSRAVVAWHRGQGAAADALVAEALRRSHGPGREFAMVFALVFDAWLGLLTSDRPRAERSGNAASERAEAVSYRQFAVLGQMLGAAGVADPDERSRRVTAALGEWGSSGARMFTSFFLAQRAEAELDAGRHDAAGPILGTALRFISESGERFYEPEVYRLLGRHALAAGRPTDAAESFRLGLVVADELGLVALGRRLGDALETLPS